MMLSPEEWYAKNNGPWIGSYDVHGPRKEALARVFRFTEAYVEYVLNYSAESEPVAKRA